MAENLLPRDGRVVYAGYIFTPTEADHLLERLLHEITWQQDKAVIFGKLVTTNRQVAWYANQPYAYRYSGTTKIAMGWTSLLLEIKQRVEHVCRESFNACLLNLYSSGADGMGWHSDAEKELRRNGVIASVSLGAERKFQFRHKISKELLSLWLQHGSLILMQGETQSYWLHRLPKAMGVKTPRVNLTFRQVAG